MPAFSNPYGLKSVSEKLRFRDGLVWTVGLTVQTKVRFQIYPAQYGRCLNTETRQLTEPQIARLTNQNSGQKHAISKKGRLCSQIMIGFVY